MTPDETRAELERLAEVVGVMPGYVDATGSYVASSERALLTVLRLLGVPIGRPSEAGRLAARLTEARRDRVLPPVSVLWQPAAAPPGLRLEGDPPEGPRVDLALHLEDGRRRRFVGRVHRRGSRGRPRLSVPGRLPIGYHRLEARARGWRASTRLLVAPRRVPQPPARSLALFAPAYALHDDRSWGAGDLRTLRRLVAYAESNGVRTVATLPLLATRVPADRDPSPYRPTSRAHWNELYLDPSSAPEFPAGRAVTDTGAFRRDLARVRRAPRVDPVRVIALKRPVLRAMHRAFLRSRSARADRFRRALREDTELRAFASFRSREGSRSTPHEPASFHAYVQWRLVEELRRFRTRGGHRRAVLCLDLPVGVHPDGFEATSARELYVRGAEIGSPPDPGYPDGQRWGLPPPHPERMRERGYPTWVAALRRAFAVGGALRIDHAMGLHRLYWVPHGHPPRDGAYVRYPFEEQYAILAIEASRRGAWVVGEDLGTVPPEVRTAMARHGILRTFVAQLEWDAPPRVGTYPRPPVGALASLNTHDMLPFAAYWANRAGRGGPDTPWGAPEAPAPVALRRALDRLARSEAKVLLVSLEDLWGETEPQNRPGTVVGSFTRPLARDLDAIERDRALAGTIRDLVRARKEGGRGRRR